MAADPNGNGAGDARRMEELARLMRFLQSSAARTPAGESQPARAELEQIS